MNVDLLKFPLRDNSDFMELERESEKKYILCKNSYLFPPLDIVHFIYFTLVGIHSYGLVTMLNYVLPSFLKTSAEQHILGSSDGGERSQTIQEQTFLYWQQNQN